MYQPAAFAVTDPEAIEAVLKGLRLGCLITHDTGGFCATHAPFLYDPERGVLTAHIARANPHWERAGPAKSLAVFQGADAYVSPGWYPSKQQHGKVVPTWNYEAAHIHGQLTWRHEPEWLRAQVGALSDHHEAARAQPWAVSDAPEDYVQAMLRGIVGLELTIEQVEVTRKLSQNRPEADREGVVAGLSTSAAESDRRMAAIMKNLGKS